MPLIKVLSILRTSIPPSPTDTDQDLAGRGLTGPAAGDDRPSVTFTIGVRGLHPLIERTDGLGKILEKLSPGRRLSKIHVA
jgi:hypothetical protein